MPKKNLLLFYALAFVLQCNAQQEKALEGWVVVDSIFGNLNDDLIQEKVVVYNTNNSNDFGKHRELHIYKKEFEKWVLWESSRTSLLNSDDGGMMGDPYGGMEIKNGVLQIHHYGGSSWKWRYTDKYRFQNGQFELIDYLSLNGKPCETWSKTDFNISTGKIDYVHEIENCDTENQVTTETQKETFYKKGIRITLKKRRSKEIKIVSPKFKHTFNI